MKLNSKFKFLSIILSSFLILSLFSHSSEYTIKAVDTVIQSQIQVEAKASILIDADSEQILQQQNEKEPLPVLSASKLLSMYIVFDQIKAGKLKLEDKVTISNNISELSQNLLYSNVPLIAGKSYTVKELISASLVVSANGAIAALAEKISGNEKSFVTVMREKAKELDMKNTFIFTSTGLSTRDIAEYGLSIDEVGSNQMSARDGAILSVELIKNFPEILEYTKQSTINFPETDNISSKIQYRNVNAMLPKLNDALYYQGVEGLKTGSSEEENSATFFGYYNANGKHLISIIIGAKTKETRFSETAKLLDFATKTLKFKEIVNENSKIKASQMYLIKGNEKNVELTTKDRIGIFTDQDKITFSSEFKPSKNHYSEYNKAFFAPIAKDADLGELTVQINNVNYLREKDKHYTIKMISNKEYNESKYSKIQDIQDFITNVFK
ncbi:MAG: D-alanyl-D-alanine carboxypeptidase family protein [Culicoidibacterales bacterium]